MPTLRNAHVDWERWPVEEYVAENYHWLHPADAAVNTLTLTEVDGRTLMVAITDLPNRETRDAILATGMEAGMQDAYDLLEGVAASLG